MKDRVEDPVRAILDVPVLADGACGERRVERERTETETALTIGPPVSPDLGFHHGYGFGSGKARLTGEAPVGVEESHAVADGVAALLDAPWRLRA